jgi:dienelactone hydrolase
LASVGRHVRPRAFRQFLAVTTGLSLVVSLAGTAVAEGPAVPLPADLAVAPPAPDVPPELRRFVGAWAKGAWDGVVPHVLVVEQVDARGDATVVFAHGDAPDWGLTRGQARVVADIDDDLLVLRWPPGQARVEYRLHGDQLTGSYLGEGVASTITLSRVPVVELPQIIAAWSPPAPLPAKTVWIPIGDLRLEATLYRPTAPARLPVVIFNHGSTGGGAISPRLTLRSPVPARFFVERGFAVLAPMRRGRGASDGDHAEGSGCGRESLSIGVERAVADLDAVMAYVGEQPWADPTRVVMAGQSRGGMLSVVYAAQRPGRVRGVVNFSGGWTGHWCDASTSFNEDTFASAGRSRTVPMLWLYSENDRYYGPDAIATYHRAFTRSGGNAALQLFPPIGGDGHRLAGYTEVWRKAVEDYLKRIGMVRGKRSPD